VLPELEAIGKKLALALKLGQGDPARSVTEQPGVTQKKTSRLMKFVSATTLAAHRLAPT
jgi:hypothetical protein